MDEAPPAGGRKIVIGTPFSAIPMEFWIYDNTTVAQLKEKIHSAKGIPTERQQLMIRKGTGIEGMADNKEGCTMTLQGQDVIPRDVNEAVLHVHLQGGCGVDCCGCTWYGPFFCRDCGSGTLFCVVQ